MSNFVGYFNGTGVVATNQPKTGKIKYSNEEKKKNIQYFKIGLYAEGSFATYSGDVQDKNIEVEKVVGVDENFDWLKVQKILGIHGNLAKNTLKNANDIISYDSKWYRLPAKKSADAVILDSKNIQETLNNFIGDFCFRFNSVMGLTKKIHTKQFSLNEPEPSL